MADISGVPHGKQIGPSHYGATDIPLPTDEAQTVYVNPKSFGYFKYKLREAFAELVGTFVFVTFGIGSIAQAKLGDGYGNWTTISLGFGLGLALGLVISESISGGHLNPAVTISLAVHRYFSWRKVPIYILAQITGAFLAAAVVFLNYHTAIVEFGGGKLSVK
ncbi:23138_t:CDS:2, partial [Racocetra persica]